MAASATDTRRWMQGASSPLRGALLGLVLDQPGRGGELASRLARGLGEQWRLNPTDVYRLLTRLVSEGLLCTEQQEAPGTARGVRVVYHPTERTSEALTRWLETVVPREPARSTLHAKLLAARGTRDFRLLIRSLEMHEDECLALARLVPPMAASAGSWRSLLLDCVRNGAWLQLQAEIEWAQQTRQRIQELADGE